MGERQSYNVEDKEERQVTASVVHVLVPNQCFRRAWAQADYPKGFDAGKGGRDSRLPTSATAGSTPGSSTALSACGTPV